MREFLLAVNRYAYILPAFRTPFLIISPFISQQTTAIQKSVTVIPGTGKARLGKTMPWVWVKDGGSIQRTSSDELFKKHRFCLQRSPLKEGLLKERHKKVHSPKSV